MKFDCSRKDLAEAMALVGHAISTRSALPVLMCVQLTAEGAQATLLACDGEMWVERRIPANVSVPGSTCVQGKLLGDLVSQLAEGTLTLEEEGTSLCVRQDGSDWRIMSLPAQEFPPVPPVEEQSKLRLGIGELRDSIARVAYAVAGDGAREVLTGVMFTYDGNKLTLVATDTHRLAVTKLERDGLGSDVTAVVPEKALRSLRDLPLADDETIEVVFSDRRLSVDAGPARVVSQLLDGNFPAWERVVPTEFTRSWMFQRDDMANVVKRAIILAKDSAYRVRFSGKPDQIVLSAQSTDKGEAKEEVPAVSKNGDVDIAFNARYVLDALAAMKSTDVRAEMTEPSRAAVFRPAEGGDDQFCVIMPMAIP